MHVSLDNLDILLKYKGQKYNFQFLVHHMYFYISITISYKLSYNEMIEALKFENVRQLMVDP